MLDYTEWYNNITTWIRSYYNKQTKEPSIELSIQEINNLSNPQKIENLRKLLSKQTSYPQHIKGKLQMYFSQILKQYPDFAFTTQMPIQYSITQKSSEQKLVCFCGKVLIQTAQIKYPVLMEIVFQENFLQRMPRFYVRNPIFPSKSHTGQPLLRTTKPNQQFVQIINTKGKKYNYRAVTGGIQINLQLVKPEKWDWVRRLIDKCTQMMRAEFPFVKKKQQIIIINQESNRDQQTENLYLLSQQIKELLKEQLPLTMDDKNSEINNSVQQKEVAASSLPLSIQKVQASAILLKSIESQIQFIKGENRKMQQFVKNSQNIINNTQSLPDFLQLYPQVTREPYQKQLLQTLTQYESAKDCLNAVQYLLEQKYHDNNNQPLSKDQVSQAMKIWEQMNEKIFYNRFFINQLVTKIKMKQT